MADFKIVTSDFVSVQITTSKDELCLLEKRFPKDISITQLKAKLELLTGGSCQTMKIDVYSKENSLVCSLTNDNALLGSYPIDDGMRLHVIDSFILSSSLDFENVEKMQISDTEYNKMDNTVKAYLMKNKMGKYNEDYQKKKEQEQQEEKETAEKLVIGSRCKVVLATAPSRLGTIMYSGLVEGLPGYFVGVKYDEPLGKNDGSVKGTRYFECPDKYGAFVKPQNVICGDFPEENYDLNEEI